MGYVLRMGDLVGRLITGTRLKIYRGVAREKKDFGWNTEDLETRHHFKVRWNDHSLAGRGLPCSDRGVFSPGIVFACVRSNLTLSGRLFSSFTAQQILKLILHVKEMECQVRFDLQSSGKPQKLGCG